MEGEALFQNKFRTIQKNPKLNIGWTKNFCYFLTERGSPPCFLGEIVQGIPRRTVIFPVRNSLNLSTVIKGLYFFEEFLHGTTYYVLHRATSGRLVALGSGGRKSYGVGGRGACCDGH